VFKTLVATGRDTGPCFAVVPAGTGVDLGALATARRDKRMEMVPLRDVEPLTGYLRGGVTALGARKRFAVVLDASAADLDAIAVSAGVKGLQVSLATSAYVQMTGATLSPIAAEPAAAAGESGQGLTGSG
jgi:Cys-tRNA(Pro)/Cys-tRNA(Cys) deacylase